MFLQVTKTQGLVLVTIMLLLSGASVYAYPATGTITGVITDAVTGEPVVGAWVIVKNQGLRTQTDNTGTYTISNIPAGMHSLHISGFGYLFNKINVIAILPNQTITISKTLNQNPSGKRERFTHCMLMQEAPVIVRPEDQLCVESKLSIVIPSDSIKEEMIKHKPVMTIDELLTQVSKVVQNLNGQVFIRSGTTYEAAYILTGTSAGIPFPPGWLGEQAEAGQAIEATQINIDPTDTIAESRKLRKNGTYRRNPLRIKTNPDTVDTPK